MLGIMNDHAEDVISFVSFCPRHGVLRQKQAVYRTNIVGEAPILETLYSCA